MRVQKSTVERFNDVFNLHRNQAECHRNGEPPKYLRFAESYIENKIDVFVLFKVSDGLPNYVTRYQHVALGEIDSSESVLTSISGNHHTGVNCCNRNKQLMLVHDVQLMERPEHVGQWLSTVRTECVDSICNGLRDSLCFSGRLGFVVGNILSYWKVDMASRFARIDILKQSEGQMIESRPKVMNGVTYDKGERGGNDWRIANPESSPIRFDIKLGNDLLCVTLSEQNLETVEIIDVLAGPLQFSPSM